MGTNQAYAATALEPGVGSAYGNGWKQLWKNFLELLLILIISWVISVPFSIMILFAEYYIGVTLLSLIYSIMVAGPLTFGFYYACLKAARGEPVEVKDLFAAFGNYWNTIGAYLLCGLIITIGYILLIVPGVIFTCKLAFVPYLIVDKKKGGLEAIGESWRMTKGYSLDIFLMGLLAIPIVMVGLLLFMVGIIPASMWIGVSLASLFYAVDLKSPTVIKQPGPFIE